MYKIKNTLRRRVTSLFGPFVVSCMIFFNHIKKQKYEIAVLCRKVII